ncbi:MAG: radical SAM protein, partial [Verrucomicrobiota bacterium]
MIEHIYVHIPYCHRICPYCGFYKHRPGNADFRRFARALLREWETAARQWELAPRTLYFGGGTPSLLPESVWQEILEEIPRHVSFAKLEEWTIEANPRTFDVRKAQVWKAGGISRVSLGVQSLDVRVLQTLGRDH